MSPFEKSGTNSGAWSTRSGVPSSQSSEKWRGGGASLGSPSGEPASTHRAIVAISASESEGSLANSPQASPAFQGGMRRDATWRKIRALSESALAYDVSGKG